MFLLHPVGYSFYNIAKLAWISIDTIYLNKWRRLAMLVQRDNSKAVVLYEYM